MDTGSWKPLARLRDSGGIEDYGKVQVQAVVVLIQYPCPG
jgi:hypothetical protein